MSEKDNRPESLQMLAILVGGKAHEIVGTKAMSDALADDIGAPVRRVCDRIAEVDEDIAKSEQATKQLRVRRKEFLRELAKRDKVAQTDIEHYYNAEIVDEVRDAAGLPKIER